MRSLSFAACLLACHVFFCASLVRAADSRPIIDMQHASWTAKDGAPTGITAITQTADGWLWIGSAMGLFRFDGVRFERMSGAQAPLSSSIQSLGLLPDGRLWITYKFGGASLLSAAGMRHFRVGEHGMPGGTAACLGQDGDGRLWLAGARGLMLLGADGNWRVPPASMAASGGIATAMLLDNRGTFHVRTNQAVHALEKHGTRFMEGPAVVGYGKLAQHPDGSIWTSDTMRPGLHLVAGTPAAPMPDSASLGNISYFLFDHAGTVWMPNYNGVSRISAAGAGAFPAQRTGAGQGLSGQHGFAVFEDREQNLWVGTESGLDRFRAYQLAPVALPRYLAAARALAPRGAGGVWVDRSIVASAGASAEPYAPPSTSTDLTSALHAAPNGVLWSGGIGALWKIHEGKRMAVPLPPGLRDPATAVVLSMATDASGALWVGMGRRGLYTLRAGAWQENGGVPGLAGLAPSVIASDARRTWFGSTNDRLTVLEQGGLRTIGRADGVQLGTVLAILPTAQGAWIGGENGVAHVEGRKVTPVSGVGDDPFAGTTGLVFAADGSLWLNGGAGLSSIAPAELRRALSEPGYRVRFGRLDYRDGLQGTASAITPFPSAVSSTDGALWFSTMGGVYTFDPARLPRNRVVPPVHITALKADGQDYPLRDGLRLPPRTGELNIDFTALSLRAPERMRLRYRLDGLDQDWHEVEGRRSVQYASLAPGHYRFRVMASNDDGLWNETGAQLSFEMLPGLAQTTWFRVLCVLAVLLLAWLLHRWRLARLTAQLQVRMNERLGERTRIARALHDTILQSMQGIILHLHVARGALPEGNAVRARLGQVIDDADQAYVDGRDQVSALRLSPAGDIEDAIAEAGECLMRDHPRTAFQLRTGGRRVLLRDLVAEELGEVAREALRNAFQHAGASHVEVTLEFGLRQLSLAVRDNGKGMAPGAGEGRWGLVGMRERVARIKGKLAVDGAVAPGTRIVVKVPARLAYAARRRWWWPS
ncbi:sensor histidine kinase [Janthinobacterium psychrotolerans]|uniref:Histidine kinase-, DNA gyrase B-, and HSP90-like ATPase n=1 Tax=Janthinobacterium psychrotolerans TaxID=1747903 RepID=A0A1A7BY62_9BURK|nr:sensor histidine kinase [Janthinobacterium psychrotolerans]OBV38566.1 Histidine kinase-, DNA gyrase B-, and HSP90-like ATPase [Janthinobacterium psychrotolerans]